MCRGVRMTCEHFQRMPFQDEACAVFAWHSPQRPVPVVQGRLYKLCDGGLCLGSKSCAAKAVPWYLITF